MGFSVGIDDCACEIKRGVSNEASLIVVEDSIRVKVCKKGQVLTVGDAADSWDLSEGMGEIGERHCPEAANRYKITNGGGGIIYSGVQRERQNITFLWYRQEPVKLERL